VEVTRPGLLYTVFQKSDAKIEITITTTNLIRIKYSLSSFNYRLSGANLGNFNKIHLAVFEQQLFKKWNSKTKVINSDRMCHSYSDLNFGVTFLEHSVLHAYMCIVCNVTLFKLIHYLYIRPTRPVLQIKQETHQEMR